MIVKRQKSFGFLNRLSKFSQGYENTANRLEKEPEKDLNELNREAKRNRLQIFGTYMEQDQKSQDRRDSLRGANSAIGDKIRKKEEELGIVQAGL